jgi:hypothetical protein
LFEPSAETPELTSENESAIYYVYSRLHTCLEDDGVECVEAVWGEMIISALKSIGLDKEEELVLPHMGCLDAELWEDGIEMLADNILWDHDFDFLIPIKKAREEIIDRPLRDLNEYLSIYAS